MYKLGIAVGFVVGALCGAAATWFGGKKYLEKQANDKAQKEIQEARQAFAKLSKELRDEAVTSSDEKDEEEGEKKKEPSRVSPDNKVKYDAAFAAAAKRESEKKALPLCERVKLKRSYNKLLLELGYDTRKEISDFEADSPFQITERECGQIDFERVVLTWLSQDDLLCDIRDGEVYTELDELIGDAGCDILSDPENCPSQVYIRNPALRLDIIVIVNNKESYVERFLAGGNANGHD